jgi:hypothetical protein
MPRRRRVRRAVVERAACPPAIRLGDRAAGSVAKNILATITDGEKIALTSISGVDRNFLQHYRHPNKALQRDWDEHGAEAFSFEVLDTLEVPEREGYNAKGDLRTLEAMWLDKLKPYGDGGYHSEPKRAT